VFPESDLPFVSEIFEAAQEYFVMRRAIASAAPRASSATRRDSSHQMGLLRRETFVLQSDSRAQEAQVDCYGQRRGISSGLSARHAASVPGRHMSMPSLIFGNRPVITGRLRWKRGCIHSTSTFGTLAGCVCAPPASRRSRPYRTSPDAMGGPHDLTAHPAFLPRQSLISLNAARSRLNHHLPRSTRPEKAFGMPSRQKLLFAIADGEHVRFARPAEDNALHSDTAVDSFAAHRRTSDLGSDHPGASYHTGSSAHHSLAPRHDAHTLQKEKFAQFVAERLNAAGAAKTFDELVIVAPPHIVSFIRQGLDAATDGKVVGVLAKDLVKTPDSELWPHVRHWVRPVHRAML
jgi:protein required for attachment to host cells